MIVGAEKLVSQLIIAGRLLSEEARQRRETHQDQRAEVLEAEVKEIQRLLKGLEEEA